MTAIVSVSFSTDTKEGNGGGVVVSPSDTASSGNSRVTMRQPHKRNSLSTTLSNFRRNRGIRRSASSSSGSGTSTRTVRNRECKKVSPEILREAAITASATNEDEEPSMCFNINDSERTENSNIDDSERIEQGQNGNSKESGAEETKPSRATIAVATANSARMERRSRATRQMRANRSTIRPRRMDPPSKNNGTSASWTAGEKQATSDKSQKTITDDLDLASFGISTANDLEEQRKLLETFEKSHRGSFSSSTSSMSTFAPAVPDAPVMSPSFSPSLNSSVSSSSSCWNMSSPSYRRRAVRKPSRQVVPMPKLTYSKSWSPAPQRPPRRQQQRQQHEKDLIEVAPGLKLRLRSSEETWKAIADGRTVVTRCMCCKTELTCSNEDAVVVCDMCWTYNPVERETVGDGAASTSPSSSSATVAVGITNDVLYRSRYWQG